MNIKFKLVKYFMVGGLSTLIHFLVASLYIFYLNDSLFVSNIIAFFIAYIFSYLMQSKFVFNQSITKQKAIKYFIVQFGALLFAISISNIIDKYNSYIQTLFVIILMPLITYIIHKFWTFKG